MQIVRHRYLVSSALLVLQAALPASGEAQVNTGDAVFHSDHAANLPTTTTLREGDLLFEVSHRFLPPVSQGADALWGLDGSAGIRLGLSYGVAPRVTLGVLRSSQDDNLELNGKVRLWEGGDEMPVALGAKVGVAWNTQLAEVEGAEDNESQSYVQLMADLPVGERLALGVVPGWLHNPRVRDLGAEDAFVLGVHGLFRIGDGASVLGEWIFTEEREDLAHDAGTFGVELETRGHFFKILFTNQPRVNPTQAMGGSPFAFEPDEWRVAFNITRLLPF